MISILLFSLILLDFFTQVAIFLAILVVISTTVKPFYSPNNDYSVQFSSVTLLCPTLCNPRNHSMPAPESITSSWSLLKLMSVESVMPSSHLIFCRPLLLLLPIPPSIRVFSNKSTLRMR